MGIVYCATNRITQEIYIGQTRRTMKERLKGHWDEVQKGENIYLYNAIRKYGWNNFLWKILDHAETKSALDSLEEIYIDMFGSAFKGIGYNLRLGGNTQSFNEETRMKMRDAKLGKSQSSEFIKKRIESIKNWKRSQETKDRIGKGNSKPHINQSKEKHPSARPILCIETGETFLYMREACNKYNLKPANITMCCQGKRHTTGGFHWQYLEKVG